MQQSVAEFFVEDITFNGGLYALIAVPAFLVFWVALAGRLGHRRIQPTRHARSKHLLHDVAFSLVSLVVFAALDFVLVTLEAHGFTQLYGDPGALGLPWLVVSVVLLIVLHDAYFYWMHRLVHHRTVYALVHQVHHRSTDPFHPLRARP